MTEDDATILVVDDDPEVRELVTEFLRDSGFRVLEAPSGAVALDLVDEDAALDLVITDIRMPEMSGFELAEEIALRKSSLKIIFMSGYFSTRPVGHPFLRKPFRLADLETAVRSELSA